MNKKTERALRRVVNYMIESERSHFVDSGEPSDHVYRDAIMVEKWLKEYRELGDH
jgi:hypothetical protein